MGSKIIEYNELVRDKIPQLIKENGEIPVYFKHVNDIDFSIELINKINIELGQFLDVLHVDREKALEELGDVYQVFMELVKNQKFTMCEVEEQRLRTIEKRGGFDDRYYLVSVEKDEV